MNSDLKEKLVIDADLDDSASPQRIAKKKKKKVKKLKKGPNADFSISDN
jgi:hypothetical protein